MAVIKVRTRDVWTSLYKQLVFIVGVSQREEEMFTGVPALWENHSQLLDACELEGETSRSSL